MTDDIKTTPESQETKPNEVNELEVLKAELAAAKSQAEAEEALRILAEQERDNAKKDIIAIKKGKKRDDVDLSEPEKVVEEPKKQDANTEAILEMARINAELARSLQNKGVAPVGSAGNAEAPAQPQAKVAAYWSEEQKNDLRKRGWSEEKIARAENIARTGSATSSMAR